MGWLARGEPTARAAGATGAACVGMAAWADRTVAVPSAGTGTSATAGSSVGVEEPEALDDADELLLEEVERPGLFSKEIAVKADCPSLTTSAQEPRPAGAAGARVAVAMGREPASTRTGTARGSPVWAAAVLACCFAFLRVTGMTEQRSRVHAAQIADNVNAKCR